MQIKSLLEDDSAVSPVIGVILMVAITVILAAVIATFVLGLGEELGNSAPTASFSTDYDGGDGELTITHVSGDSIKASEIFVRGSSGTGGETLGNWTTVDGSVSGSNSKVVGGDRAVITVGSDYDIRVVYQAANGGSSATLTEDSGPDA